MELDGITFQSGGMKDLRILPVTTLPTGISEGTIVNHNGEWKRFTGVVGTWKRTTSPTALFLHTIENEIPAGNEYFGYAVDSSSNYMISGAYSAVQDANTGAGAAYIYDINTGEYLHTLLNPEPASSSFGIDVSINNNYAVVGYANYSSGNGAIFVYDPATGALLRTIAPDAALKFGNITTSIDGDYVVAGGSSVDSGAITNSGTAYIYNLATGALVHTLVNPTVVDHQKFGERVKISGNYAAVSATGRTVGGNTNAGAVHIFNVTTGVLERTITAPVPTISSQFGYNIHLDGNNIIISEYDIDTVSNVYIFNVTTGVLVQTLANPGVTNFGTSGNVAMSGNFAAVSTIITTVSGITQAGSVYVYNVTTGALVHTIDNPTPTYQDRFGTSISISGDNIVVGAQLDEIGISNKDSGSVHIFDTTTAVLKHAIVTPGRESGNLGYSVAISNSIALVASKTAGYNNVPYSGVVHVHDLASGEIVRALTNPSTQSQAWFGESVAVDGDYAVVGAHYYDISGKLNAGRAYIFNVSTGALLHTLESPNPTAQLFFGQKVAISGNYVTVAEPRVNSGAFYSGRLYVYDATTGVRLRTINPPVPASQGYFGFKMELDGTNLIVGYREGGKVYIYDVTTGNIRHTFTGTGYFGEQVTIGGNYALVSNASVDTWEGAVYVYDVTTGALLHTVNHPDPTGISVGAFGLSSMSIDGNLALICSRGDSAGIMTNSGRAYLLELNTGVVLQEINDPTPQISGYFGHSSAAGGGYGIIGTPYKKHAVSGANNAGEAYIYKLT